MQKGWEGEGEVDGERQEEQSWDIDTDSGFYDSVESSNATSPLKRQMSMLGL